MAPDRETNLFLRAALHRIESADILLQHRRYADASYLAGYGIECALKAVILADIPLRQRPVMIRAEFRGARGHDFEHLHALLLRSGRSVPASVRLAMREASSWSTVLRYNPREGGPADAERILSAARDIVAWAMRSV